MTESKNPTDIAREALKRLAIQHLPPTPANFQVCYNEIAGVPDLPPFPEKPLRQLADALVAHGTQQEGALDELVQAIGRRSWQGVTDALQSFAQSIDERPATAQVTPVSLLPADFASSLSRVIDGFLPFFW